MSGKSGRLRGKRNEKRLVRLLKQYIQGGKLSWLLSVERSTRDLDDIGIDVVVHTEKKPLFLQVKSSKKEAQRFRKKYYSHEGRSIAVVTITEDSKDKEILQKAVNLLTKMFYSTDTGSLVFRHDNDDWKAVDL